MNTLSHTDKSATRRAPATPERVQERAAVSPRVDVYENADALLVVAEIPGATLEGTRIHFDKGQLTLEARREVASPGTALFEEHRPVDYYRAFAVPQGIDASRIGAELRAGVLSIRLPKSEANKPRQIEIKAS
jgi:HSP20 family molecular chaperone IbpA